MLLLRQQFPKLHFSGNVLVCSVALQGTSFLFLLLLQDHPSIQSFSRKHTSISCSARSRLSDSGDQLALAAWRAITARTLSDVVTSVRLCGHHTRRRSLGVSEVQRRAVVGRRGGGADNGRPRPSRQKSISPISPARSVSF